MEKIKDYGREIDFCRTIMMRQIREVMELITREIRGCFEKDIAEIEAKCGVLKYIDIMALPNRDIYLLAVFEDGHLSVCTKLGEKRQFEDSITNTLMKWSAYAQDKYMWVFKAAQAL